MGTRASPTLVLTTLSIFLGAFFIFYGTIKVTPKVSLALYKELGQSYKSLAKVIPVFTQLEYKVKPRQYRLTVGWIEIICGLMLVLVPNQWERVKLVPNALLLLSSFNAVYSHWMVKDPFDRIAPHVVFAMMLICRLIVNYQVHRRLIQISRLTKKVDKVIAGGKSSNNPDSGPMYSEVGKGAMAGNASKFEKSLFEIKKTK